MTIAYLKRMLVMYQKEWLADPRIEKDRANIAFHGANSFLNFIIKKEQDAKNNRIR